MGASMTPRAVCLLLISLALCHAAAGQATPAQQIVQEFKEITELSNKVRTETERIDFVLATILGNRIPDGLRAIVARVGRASSMIQNLNMKELGAADAKTVVAALTTFVEAQKSLLGVVIDKHRLVTLSVYFDVIRRTLVNLEAVVDMFAFNLIAVIPTEKPAADQQFRSLGVTIKLAISTYQRPL
ncbi:hypothetical protein M758_9G073100 [Ceratodon purpureus]|nr:hypothetical protein M758_9G073100 [Ceratodon purpureus]